MNLIGEHTDYNRGLALPFAIAEGVTARAEALPGERIEAHARDLGERDVFALGDRSATDGWRAFVRGTVAELSAAGFEPSGARVEIGGDLPRGAGLSSSAALEVSLCLALLALAGHAGALDRISTARLCGRVENNWVGAHTGLLDQLASLCGQPENALCIDFSTLAIEPVPLRLEGWRLVVLDSGERRAHASSAYNQRRLECKRACELLGVSSLREANSEDVAELPAPLRERVRHVISENERVLATVAALRAGDLAAVGELMSASHASLRDDYAASTRSLETAVARLLDAGAAGARMVGGGFGGSVLGLFPPGARRPDRAREVRPSAGARVL